MDDRATILIADSSSERLEATSRILETAGYGVLRALSGNDCLSLLDHEKPDLILLDDNLSDMSALDLNAEIRKHPSLRDSFVVVIGNGAHSSDEIGDELASGIDEYLTGPIGEKELVERVRTFLRIKSTEDELRTAQNREIHLNTVLRAIRNVNQLIVREQDPEKLINDACVLLTEDLGYTCAWIVLLDEKGNVSNLASSPIDIAERVSVEAFMNGGEPACFAKALASHDLVVLQGKQCTGCPVVIADGHHAGLTMRLENDGQVFGVLTVSISQEFSTDAEELGLFRELAGDIAFALRRMELAKEIQCLSRFPSENRNPVMRISPDGILIYANEASEHVLEAWGTLLGMKVPDEYAITVTEVLRSQRVREEEVICNGSVYLLAFTPVEGPFVNIYGMDITKQRTALKAVYEGEERFRNLFEHMSDGMAIYEAVANGEDFLFSAINPSGCDITHMTREQVIGRSVSEVFPGVKEMGLFDVLRRVYKTGKAEHHPVSYYRDEKIDIWVDNYVYKLPGGEVVAVFEDVTDEKKALESLRQERDLTNLMMQTSPVGITVLDTRGAIIYANGPAEKVLGLSKASIEDRMYNSPEWNITDESGEPFPDEQLPFQRVLRSREPVLGVIHTVAKPDGSRVILSINAAPLLSESGDLQGVVTTIEDITERRQMEKRQELYASSLLVLNRANEWKRLIEDLLGEIKSHTGIEAIGIRLREEEDYPYFATNGFAVPFIEEENHLCKRGENGELVRNEDGDICLECMCGTVIEGRTNSEHPFFTADGSFWTNSTSDLLAMTREEQRGSKTRNACNRYGYESVALVPLRAGADVIGLLQLNDHRRNCFSLDMIEFFEKVAASIGIAFTRKRIEEALKERESILNETGAIAKIGGWKHDLRTGKATWTRALYDILEFDDGEPPGVDSHLKYYPEEERGILEDAYRKAVEDHVPFDLELRGFTEKKRELWCRIIGKPILKDGICVALQGTLQDITERKKRDNEREEIELQLRQAQKMEAIGQLAGGVAHDFNNLLQTMKGYSQLLVENLQPGTTLHDFADEIRHSTERAASLTTQLLAFSRRQVLKPSTIDLNDAVENTLRMVERTIQENIEVDYQPFRGSLSVYVDSGQIDQVVINLCINARDAMPEGGKLVVETGKVSFDEDFCKGNAWAIPGDYALISVKDQGIGMDELTISQIFEPFFTTKEVGKGTGLGLATVYGIVKQHEGLVHVRSEAARGSTFEVYLPLVRTKTSVAEKDVLAKSPGGRERILLAEDDSAVRKLTRRILEEAGYSVMEAANGEEALALLEYLEIEPEMAIIDVVMPKKSGKAVLEHIRKFRPKMRILLMSGYSTGVLGSTILSDKSMNFIQKPFNSNLLLHKVREILDEQEDSV